MFPLLMCDISHDKIFRDQFKKYVAEEKYVAKRSIVDSLWFYEFEHADNNLTSAEYRHVVDDVVDDVVGLTLSSGVWRCLIQFWRAEEERVVNNISVCERRFLLTLRNQPFLLQGPYNSYGIMDDELYRYRTKMHDVIVNGDGTGGPIGRVFQNNRMESTPDVSYYSDNEYPQLDIALSCGVNSSLVLPWLDSSGCVVGAIEFVSVYWLPSNPLLSNSSYLDYCQRLCGQYDSEMDSFISVVTDINEVIRKVCERRDEVRYAQTWMICKHCNSLSTASRCAQELKSLSKYFNNIKGSNFLEYQDYYNLKKGEGVVGKVAELSNDLVYCEDVAKLSITEYPLAHFARNFRLSSSFAIRLKSNQTGDQVYVLEFFLHPDYVKGKNLMATLVPIVEKMRQCFKTFKFASGGDIGDNLSVQVISANSSDKVENLKNKKLNTFMVDSPVASASTVQCEMRVTIKAIYGVTSISFQLSASCGIHELYRQVSQKLQLADGTFDLKYPDDNDHIELICDEDLQVYISSSREQEIYTLLVFVVPR